MNLTLSIVGVLAIGGLYVLLPVFAQTYRRLRGPRVVRCPETLQPTVIDLDARRAAMGELRGRPRLNVRQCARWKEYPAHRDCDQDCLKGVNVVDAEKHALLTSPLSESI